MSTPHQSADTALHGHCAPDRPAHGPRPAPVGDRGILRRRTGATVGPRTRASLPAPWLALACAGALVWTTGCQTPQGPNTVAPPGTGMIGQPATYGSWATPPQGAAYPPVSSPPPMPGPAAGWQGAAPAAPTNTWSWSQPPAGAPGSMPPPSLTQYGNQLQGQAQQFQQGVTNQAQQYANQLQAQPQQYADQMQQQLAAQQQQLTNQAQNTLNQYQQNLNNQWQQYGNQLQNQTNQAFNTMQQQAQQYLQPGQQQVTAQMPQYQPAGSTNPANTGWNPFATSATSLPPARATPVQTVPRY